jgi:hypothetical protein
MSQGCVAIRNVAGISPDLLFENIQPNDKVIFNITNRYFEASKVSEQILLFQIRWSQTDIYFELFDNTVIKKWMVNHFKRTYSCKFT